MGNWKGFLRRFPLRPLDQANFVYSCSFTSHTSYKNGMLDQRGEGCQNAQKHTIIKGHLVTNFIQTCSLISIYNDMHTVFS